MPCQAPHACGLAAEHSSSCMTQRTDNTGAGIIRTICTTPHDVRHQACPRLCLDTPHAVFVPSSHEPNSPFAAGLHSGTDSCCLLRMFAASSARSRRPCCGRARTRRESSWVTVTRQRRCATSWQPLHKLPDCTCMHFDSPLHWLVRMDALCVDTLL